MVKKVVKKSIARKSHKVIKAVIKKEKTRVKEDKKNMVEKEEVKEKEVESSVPAVEEESSVEVPVEVAVDVEKEEVKPKLPVYDNCEILEILPEGHSKTHYRCFARDRNGNQLTLDVPKNIF